MGSFLDVDSRLLYVSLGGCARAGESRLESMDFLKDYPGDMLYPIINPIRLKENKALP